MKRFLRFLLVFVFCCGLLSIPTTAEAVGSCPRQSNGPTYRVMKESSCQAESGWRAVSGSRCPSNPWTDPCRLRTEPCDPCPSPKEESAAAPAPVCRNAGGEQVPALLPTLQEGQLSLWRALLSSLVPGESPSPETVVPAMPSPQPAPATAEEDFRLAVVELVNRERAAEGLPALTWDEDLAAAAAVRSREIQSSFSHTRPNGSSCFSALQEAGVAYRQAGENIALGQRTPEQVVRDWMNSPGHRANIMNSAYSRIGVGLAAASSGGYAWAQFFAD